MRHLSSPTNSTGGRRALAGLSLLVVLLTGTTVMPWQRVTATANAPTSVRVAKVAVGDLQAAVSLNGELRATDQIDVASRVGSRVSRVLVTVGQTVNAGEVLAELERTSLEASLTAAQASLAKERANLAKLQTGARAEDLVKEASAVQAAEARLEQVLRGPRPEDIDAAVQKLNQARENRAKTASQLGLAKEQARLAVEQATLALQATQATYGAAKLVYDEAVRTNKDPNIGSCPSTNRRCDDLTDIRLRQYKAAFESAEITMRAAEQALENRRLASEDARQQEVIGLRIENSKVLDAQASLDKARGGSDPDTIAKAKADLEAARASQARVVSPSVEPDLQAALASVSSAEANLRLAEMNLAEARVVAPFAGVVTQRLVSPGSVVSSGTALVQLVSQTIEVRLSADDSQIAFLETGQRADIRLTAYPGVVFAARVEAVSPSANLTSRTFTITATPDAGDPRLKPGMLAQADVAAINRRGVKTIPETAIMSRLGETSVFVVDNGRARRKAITAGVRGNGLVEIIDGLATGDSVIVDGQAALNDNDQVVVAS